MANAAIDAAWAEAERLVVFDASSNTLQVAPDLAQRAAKPFEVLVAGGFYELTIGYVETVAKDYLASAAAPAFWSRLAEDTDAAPNLQAMRAVRGADAHLGVALDALAQVSDALDAAAPDGAPRTVLALPALQANLQRYFGAVVFDGRPGVAAGNGAPGRMAGAASEPEARLGALFKQTLGAVHNDVEAATTGGKSRSMEVDGADAEGERDADEEEAEEEEAEEEDDDEEEEDTFGEATEEPLESEEVTATWRALRSLGWLSMLERSLRTLLTTSIQRRVAHVCGGKFEVRTLDKLRTWVRMVLLRWLGEVHGYVGTDGAPPGGDRVARGNTSGSRGVGGNRGSGDEAGEPMDVGDGGDVPLASVEEQEAQADMEAWGAQLDLSVHQILIGELFDIIMDFPDSAVAVVELRDALDRTQQYSALGDALRGTLIKRILHPGATTSQIIDIYISTIKVLRLIDPSDVVLQTVASPVRAYLRQRKDTVRCIVTSLTDEHGDLYEELQRHHLVGDGPDSDDDEAGPGVNWQPRLRSTDSGTVMAGMAAAGGGGVAAQSADILGMLVSIYGSKEIYVNEYRAMLAQKLVANVTYDTGREVETLELFKVRFGEACMHQCEIMVRDVGDSKRLNANVHTTIKAKTANKAASEGAVNDGPRSAGADGAEVAPADVVTATIVSEHFWPSLVDDSMELHPWPEKQLTRFNDTYSVLKTPRSLLWKPTIGTVDLDLEFPDKDGQGMITRTFSVSPMHANLILFFDEDSEQKDAAAAAEQALSGKPVTLTDAQLSNFISRPVAEVRRKMSLWVTAGVVSMTPTASGVSYTANERPGDPVSAAEPVVDDQPSIEVKNLEKAIDMYKKFICGMLQNLGPKALEDIHNMLKMYTAASEDKYDKSPRELGVILNRLVMTEEIEKVDGTYRIRKK